MAKRKPAQAAVSGKKAPGAQKPRKRKTPAVPIPAPPVGETCPFPPRAEEDHYEGGLTIEHEKFVELYIETNGNATEAYAQIYKNCTRGSATALACRLMKKQIIADAIETKREEMRRLLNISREKLLRIQAGMALAHLEDFTDVLRSPSRKDSYRGLGDLKHAIKGVTQGEFGNSIQLVGKQEAVNELWKKLGYQQGTDPTGERDVTGTALEAARQILGRKPGEGSK